MTGTRRPSPDVERYVALVRGINVGGRNKVPMAELRTCLTEAGYLDVRTYIQSGNVAFDSPVTTTAPQHAAQLEHEVESLIEQRFGIAVPVVVRSRAQVGAVIADAPTGFGADPTTYLCDVVFLKSPLTTETALAAVSLRPGVDSAWAGIDVVYFQRLSARRTESRLNKVMSSPAYKLMTIRNWATTQALTTL